MFIFPRGLKKKQNFRSSLELPNVVQFIKDRKGEKQVIYYQIEFHLNEESLAQIHQAKRHAQSLALSSENLEDLHAYLLSEGGGLSGLTFLTYYEAQSGSEALLRSYLGGDGEVIHQLCRRCLQEESFALSLNQAHHWLIQQLLQQVAFPVKIPCNAIAWSVILGLGIFCFLIYILTGQPFSWMLLLSWVLILWGLQRLLILGLKQFKPHFYRWQVGKVWSQSHTHSI